MLKFEIAKAMPSRALNAGSNCYNIKFIVNLKKNNDNSCGL